MSRESQLVQSHERRSWGISGYIRWRECSFFTAGRHSALPTLATNYTTCPSSLAAVLVSRSLCGARRAGRSPPQNGRGRLSRSPAPCAAPPLTPAQNAGSVDPMKMEMAASELDMITDVL
jgi:hypothetical protein